MSCGGCRDGGVHAVPLPPAAFKTPQYQPADGSITFPEGVEMLEIDGYEVDPDDDRRLVTKMPPCMHRITGVMLQKSGTYAPHHVCTGPCPHKSKPVTFQICTDCPISKGADS